MGSVGCCCVQRCVDRFQIALAHWRFAAADVAAAVMMSAEQCSQLPHLLMLYFNNYDDDVGDDGYKAIDTVCRRRLSWYTLTLQHSDVSSSSVVIRRWW